MSTRRWLYERSQETCGDEDLYDEDINWVMKEEGNNTLLLKLYGDQWFTLAGHFITLAEVFHRYAKELNCLDIYKMWLSLPMFAHKRVHTEPNSANAQLRRNARQYQHMQTGHYGLGP